MLTVLNSHDVPAGQSDSPCDADQFETARRMNAAVMAKRGSEWVDREVSK